MAKKMTLTALAAIAILGFTTNTTFAFGGHRGDGGFRHQESRQEFRRDYHRDYYRRDFVIVRPRREPVYVCPPRSGLIIGPFIIIGF